MISIDDTLNDMIQLRYGRTDDGVEVTFSHILVGFSLELPEEIELDGATIQNFIETYI